MKTRTKHFNKFFSFLLAMLLVVGMLPTTAFAHPTDATFSHINDVVVVDDETVTVTTTVTTEGEIDKAWLCTKTDDNPYELYSDVSQNGNELSYAFRKSNAGKTYAFAVYTGDSKHGYGWSYSNYFTVTYVANKNPSNAHWEGRNACWTMPTEANAAYGTLYKGTTSSGKSVGSFFATGNSADCTNLMKQNGAGTYFFDVYVRYPGEGGTYTYSDKIVSALYTYDGSEDETPTTISSVALNYTNFVAGQPIANAIPTTATTGVSVSNYEWAVNGSGTLGANFEADTNYRLTIYLKAADGYALDGLNNDSITVNGAKPYSSGKTEGTQTSKGDYMIVVYPGTPEVNAPTEYSIKVNSGKATIGAGNEVTKAKESDVVTITANAAPEGKVFDKWEVVSGSVALTDANAEETTFTMPGEAVEVTATYKEAVSLSKVTSVAVDYTGFVAGQPIANASPTTATTGVSVSNYEWAVNGSGTLGANFEADTDYKLTIYLKAADGYTLDELTNDSITVNGATPYSSGKTMGTDVAKGDYKIVVYPGTPEVNASAEYTIKVNSGKATIGAGSEIDKAKENDVITITADSAPEGKEFDKWEVVNGTVTLADATAESTTFTMPGEAVEVTATYKDKTVTPPAPVTYTITKGNGQTVTKGNTANFVSDAPFDKFVKVQVDGADVAASNYTAVSGSTDVTFNTDYINSLSEGNHTIAIVSNDGQATGSFTVQAASAPDPEPTPTEYAITVNNGKASVGAGTEITKAEKDTVVTITANAANEGKEFAGWTVVSGTITLADASKETTTFTMPGEAVEITATYKDKETTPTDPTKPGDETNPTNPNEPGKTDPTDTGKTDTGKTDTSKTDTGKSESPKTGDTTNLALWIAVLFISGGAVSVLGVKSRKRKVQD